MSRRFLWLSVGVTSAGYAWSLVWASRALGEADLETWLWVVGIVPSMILAGAIMILKRPDNPIGPLTFWGGVVMFLIPQLLEVVTLVAYNESGAQPWMWLPMWLAMTFIAAGFVVVIMILVLLPDGRVREKSERRFLSVAWSTALLPTLSLFANETVITHSESFKGMADIPSPVSIPALEPLGEAVTWTSALTYVLFLVAAWLQYRRYRAASVRERKQVRWVLFGGTIGIALGVFPYLLIQFGVETPFGPTSTWGWLSIVPLIIFIASVVIAVLEPRWIDVDIVIRKSFVYGVLSFLILVLYIGMAAAFGVAAGSRLEIEIAVIITVLVALAFHPARQWLQRVADRWVFGARPTKYEAVTEFRESIERAEGPDVLLPQLVDTIQRTLDLEWVAASLDNGANASSGVRGEEPIFVSPIGAGDEPIGEVQCGPGSRELDADDLRLVDTLAGQLGMAIMNARLAGRIVTAAENERRRIERNIHDGAQQELVALVARLGMAKSAAQKGELNPQELDSLQTEAKSILSDLRDLAQGIHPSVLSDGGLVEAVEERCAHLPIAISVSVSPGLRIRRYGDDIEGAAYFVVTESLANVLKHAEARHVSVSMQQENGRLMLEVADDGVGFDPRAPNRNGLAGLDDRVRALGGTFAVSSRPGAGTRISAAFPVRSS